MNPSVMAQVLRAEVLRVVVGTVVHVVGIVVV